MTLVQAFNEEQRTRWNGIDGEYWTSQQDRLDRTLAPVTGPLLAWSGPRRSGYSLGAYDKPVRSSADEVERMTCHQG